MAQPTQDPPKPEARPTAALPAKNFRISVNGVSRKTVHGKDFGPAPKVYSPSDLGWSADQFAEARKDPNLVIEELDANGKVFVSRRNRVGAVVPEGDEGVAPPKPKRAAAAVEE